MTNMLQESFQHTHCPSHHPRRTTSPSTTERSPRSYQPAYLNPLQPPRRSQPSNSPRQPSRRRYRRRNRWCSWWSHQRPPISSATSALNLGTLPLLSQVVGTVTGATGGVTGGTGNPTNVVSNLLNGILGGSGTGLLGGVLAKRAEVY
jgi:hypothetical protein